MKTVAKIFIILGMILGCVLVFPTVIGLIAINKIDYAKEKKDLTKIGIITLLFCNVIGGILMLVMSEECVKKNEKKWEWFRKMLVKLKRNPNYIPLAFIIICMLISTLNMTDYSHTIAYVNTNFMGISHFILTLCAFLMVVSYLQCYPKRKEPKKIVIGLVCAMIVISIAANAVFIWRIIYATKYRVDPAPIVVTKELQFIADSKMVSFIHIGYLFITLVVVLLVSVFRKQLSKLDTSIEISEIATDEAIDVSEAD